MSINHISLIAAAFFSVTAYAAEFADVVELAPQQYAANTASTFTPVLGCINRLGVANFASGFNFDFDWDGQTRHTPEDTPALFSGKMNGKVGFFVIDKDKASFTEVPLSHPSDAQPGYNLTIKRNGYEFESRYYLHPDSFADVASIGTDGGMRKATPDDVFTEVGLAKDKINTDQANSALETEILHRMSTIVSRYFEAKGERDKRDLPRRLAKTHDALCACAKAGVDSVSTQVRQIALKLEIKDIDKCMPDKPVALNAPSF